MKVRYTPGSRRYQPNGKGVRRETESEGSCRQSSEPMNGNRIKGMAERTRLQHKPKSPIPGLCHINAAAAWNEGYCTLSGEVCGACIKWDVTQYCKVWLNPQKSVWVVVPRKPMKVCRGKGSADHDI